MQRRVRRGERENGELKWKKTKTKLYIRNGTEIYRNFNKNCLLFTRITCVVACKKTVYKRHINSIKTPFVKGGTIENRKKSHS